MKLLNYKDEPVEIPVDLDDPSIKFAIMFVISGDEVLNVDYEDGDTKTYDSDMNCRIMDFFDDVYTVVSGGKWEVDREAFMSRTSSYWHDMEIFKSHRASKEE